MFELFTIIDEVLLDADQLGPSEEDKDFYMKEKLIHRYHHKFIRKLGLCIKIQRMHPLKPDESIAGKGTSNLVLPGIG